MARGPKKHLKRLNAPKHWMLDKLGGTWAPRTSTGPHKLRECLPLSLILRNRLRYSLTRRETLMIVMRRLVQVDHKVRTDLNYPAGFQDVVQIPKTDEVFRLLYDVKGRFVLHRITKEEAAYKLCRVQKVQRGSKASIGRNPFHTGQAGSIPFLVTHDGRTIRFADPAVAVHDTIKIDLATGKQIGHIKFDVGNLVMITKGNNVGRVGVLVAKERHLGSFDIVHVRDRKGNAFSTRIQNVFVIGEGNKPAISLPKGKGIKQTILEEQAARLSGDKGKKE
jgi:small subunit ribosomal protein S4e